MGRILSREELLGFTPGAMALSTGGGGVRLLEENVEKWSDDALEQGKVFKLAELSEVPDDQIVLSGIGTGGGVRVEQRLRWMGHPGYFAADGGVNRTGSDRQALVRD